MDNIIKIQCREDIVERINQTLKRLEEKGFSGIFNGNNFDLIDNQGKCLNSEYGIDFYGLEEYSLLNCNDFKIRYAMGGSI